MTDCKDRHVVKLETFDMRANDPRKFNGAINTCLINLKIIKICTFYCFGDIIIINNLDLNNIWSDGKYLNLSCSVRDKTLYGATLLCIIFDEVEGYKKIW